MALANAQVGRPVADKPVLRHHRPPGNRSMSDSSPSILVVDDSKVSRTMVIGLLRNRMPEARFNEAPDGEKAIELFTAAPANFVVMDFNMPGLNGVETAQRLLALRPETPIVLLTANAQAAVQAKADAAGVTFMRKPIKGELADQIVAMVRVAA